METTVFRETACDGLYQILVWRLGVFPRDIYLDSSLTADFGFDLIDLADLGAALVEKFGIDAGEMAAVLASEIDVDCLIRFLAKKLSEGKSK